MQAMENFFYVPRYRGHTLNHPIKYKYGGVLVQAPPNPNGPQCPSLQQHHEKRLPFCMSRLNLPSGSDTA